MIKTLRITSVAAVILSAVFFAFPVVFGAQGDEQIEKFLNSASVIEKFEKARRGEGRISENQISPLVKQAQAFALYLNPPKSEKRPPTPRKGAPVGPRRPSSVSAKFDLIGTSYYPLRPDLSLALIDQPGKGLRWVRQSSEVGHLIIEQIKDGIVVVKDGQKTFEMTAEREGKISLLKGDSPPGRTAPVTAPPPLDEAGVGLDKTDSRLVPPFPAGEEGAAMAEEFAARMRALQADAESGKAGSQADMEEMQVKMEELIAEFRAGRIDPEEAEMLDELGEELRTVPPAVGSDPNEVEQRRARTREIRARARARRTKRRAREAKQKSTDANSPD